MKMSLPSLAGVVATSLALAFLSGCSGSDSQDSTGQAANNDAQASKGPGPSWCGPKEASLAYLDGMGGNSWKLIAKNIAHNEASKCPSVTKFEYANGHGSTQQAISDIKSMTARGFDALIVFGDAGPAVLPALTSAYEAGRVVVPYRVHVGGEAGKNYTKFVGTSFKSDGKHWAHWIQKILPDGGNILFISGPAGNSQGAEELEGMKSVLGPSYKFINTHPYDVTNWDPALTQRVLASEISKHDEIDVIVSDFGPSLVGALSVFKKFGRSIPAIATTDGNSLGCFWKNHHKNNPKFKLFTVTTGIDNVRLAVHWAVAKATKGQVPDSATFQSRVFENSVTGKPNEVQCRPNLPGDIYLSSQMPAKKQASIINQ
ncbi:substrate-binding domain-containing protein [Salinisphaera sp.]|uniref:substrate-binding domain-containing protein n=1 Tax=Salinisphaera sp. TaxID=1914330 RepID=UPI002D79FF9D|nr:substrate-binding domain-containing protein [Salinisphaera sp.]HET7315772.1 substrate-binding domain-containing protein [Salinisphaera sp.]